MRITIFPAVFLVLASTPRSIGQDLDAHRWKNRIVVVLSESASSAMYREQLAEFSSDPDGLNERRIIVYRVLPEGYGTGFDDGRALEDSDALYRRFMQPGDRFKMVLIGLDGGVKLQSGEML